MAYGFIHNRFDKLAPKAQIGVLVGYAASNIWHIWVPSTNRVIMMRDVTFDISKRYRDDSTPIKIVEADYSR